VTIKTRLRLSPRDAAVLDDLGQVVALARGKDLAERCKLGTLAAGRAGRAQA
jgi:hypothetical protein